MTDHPPERVKLEAGLARLGIEGDARSPDLLLAYMAQLREWSTAFNLVAPGERGHLLARHVLDSLSIQPWLNDGPLLDAGCGAGLPGVPLAIVDPGLDVTLVDSAGKKVRFIRHVKRHLGLDNIHPLHGRVEKLDNSRPFATITSRAFASLADFATATRRCADGGTRWLAMKAGDPAKEISALPGWIRVDSVEALTVPYLHAERHLVIMSLAGHDN